MNLRGLRKVPFIWRQAIYALSPNQLCDIGLVALSSLSHSLDILGQIPGTDNICVQEP